MAKEYCPKEDMECVIGYQGNKKICKICKKVREDEEEVEESLPPVADKVTKSKP